MSLLAPSRGLKNEQIVDSRTGHRIVIGYWDFHWGFHCLTCSKKFLVDMRAGFDLMAEAGKLAEAHFENATVAPDVVQGNS
jgi:hypothetical protein